MTDAEQEIDRLRRRLGWEAGGPLAQVSTQATDTLVSSPGTIARLNGSVIDIDAIARSIAACALGFGNSE
jgi:polygalacturonase